MHTAPASATDVVVARQPIFDGRQRVFAYELLFRSSQDNYFAQTNPDVATSHVLSNGMVVGLGKLTDHKPAFVNFSRTALVENFAFVLSPSDIVIEVLETVEPDEQVIDACRRLKAAGYRLALDDFVDGPQYAPLIELADYIKVDVLATSPADRHGLVTRYATRKRRLLAEKVETREMMKDTVSEGYEFFQGYFFSRPTIVSSRALSGYRLNYLRLLRELNRDDVDIRRLETIVKQEASIALRLLRRVNSAAYGFRMTTSSLGHALVLLGEREIRACATVWSLAELARDMPSELIVASTLRARFCELLATSAGLADQASDLFLLGMFSMLDVILEQPMAEIVETLPLGDDVRDALLGRKNRLRRLFDCILAYERGEWETLPELEAAAGVPDDALAKCYPEAIGWTQAVFGES